jgi:hypothetical protein
MHKLTMNAQDCCHFSSVVVTCICAIQSPIAVRIFFAFSLLSLFLQNLFVL